MPAALPVGPRRCAAELRAVAAAAAPGAPPVPPRGCSWCPCAAYSCFGRQATLSPLVRRPRAPVAVPSLREEGGGVRSRVRAPDHFRGRLRGGRPSRRSALHARCAVVASPASLTRASRSALGRALARGARASQPVAHALQRLCRSHTPPPLPSRSARRDARLRPPPTCTATLRSAVRSAALTAVRLSSSRRPASGPGSAPYHRWGALASPPWRRAAGRAAAPSAAAAAARRAVLGARLGARSGGGARSHARCTACMPETICGRAQSCRRRWCTGRGAATAPWRGCSRCPCAAHARLGGRATPSPLVHQPRAPVTTPPLWGGAASARVCVRLDRSRGRRRGRRHRRRST